MYDNRRKSVEKRLSKQAVIQHRVLISDEHETRTRNESDYENEDVLLYRIILTQLSKKSESKIQQVRRRYQIVREIRSCREIENCIHQTKIDSSH